MSAEPTVRTCPNCGAPLQLDVEGRCRWCQAYVDTLPGAGGATDGLSDSSGSLVPDAIDTLALPVSALHYTNSLYHLGRDPAVQDYLGRTPGLRPAIRSLSSAVAAAGARLRDAGLDPWNDAADDYTPGEKWLLELAVDVIVLLDAVDGVSAATRRDVADFLQFTPDMGSHWWRKQIEKAGAGPAAFQQLRAEIPPRPVKKHHVM